MLSETPKQYLPLCNSTVIENTLDVLLQIPDAQQAVVAIRNDDRWWPQTSTSKHPQVITTTGGDERADSVMAALGHLLAMGVDRESWVLVHDAARPCVRLDDISALIDSSLSHGDGGILALPVRDTMKLSDDESRIEKTVDRDHLWHALTPQMFRLGELHDAIQSAQEAGFPVTDEASAMEFSGFRPRLVEGKGDNIKITRPADLALAEYFLMHRGDS
ncbi:2-C-methyl-D-erythritol 4-phosphate cytidylyltransferase [Solemya velum gill symbiont]|nr:2-C-methyl-D-erythritol 4-phosphate cytidylyltransferase [Solemya velum gill symbiont]OOY36620.1 2-C-methyl-D-erythritol 4-phosphate cytidylyltransferase [Solemya velum gill symbiont]OOY39916.1 2-C-methyl-D-erythritol 4-phosphate cytidylyltransferase [Solemya velum gill symbiont]OOY44204.1 2-C-methyl-D-erythritol 4-phosphate cytidylyltransferase [Solemya velum gill symbiont]OOY49367.1 2-C-methyl-D-erythritol 4-phosphate cytidylyltransferase [Solemya velum gill symbiont]